MLIFLAKLTLNVLSNAIGLLAASLILSGFSLDGLSFVVAVVIFSLATTVLGPLILKIALSSANYLVGGISLVTTFVGLLITDLVTDGISISGTSTWLIAAMVVWAFSIIGSIVLPLFLFKKTLEKNKTSKQ